MKFLKKDSNRMGVFFSCAAACLLTFVSCGEAPQNVLTPQEEADGWKLLFDGKTMAGWKDYNGTTLTQPWGVVDGCIQANGQGSDASGYIVTDKEYVITFESFYKR